jgi:hypothetical protein
MVVGGQRTRRSMSLVAGTDRRRRRRYVALQDYSAMLGRRLAFAAQRVPFVLDRDSFKRSLPPDQSFNFGKM